MNSSENDEQKRVRGVVLTQEALDLLQNALIQWWASEGNKGRPSREEIRDKLQLSVQTVNRIIHHRRVDKRSLKLAFAQMNLPWKDAYCESQELGNICEYLEYALNDITGQTLLNAEALIRSWAKMGRLGGIRDWLIIRLRDGEPILSSVQPYAFHLLTRLCEATGNFEEMEYYGEQALSLFEQKGDLKGQSGTLSVLSCAASRRDDLKQHRDYQEKVVAIQRTLHDTPNIALSGMVLGDIAMRQQDFNAAYSYYGEAISLLEGSSFQRELAHLYAGRAHLAAVEGDYSPEIYKEVLTWHERAIRTAEESGDRDMTAYVVAHLGRDALDFGKYKKARAAMRRSLELYRQEKNTGRIRDMLEGFILLETKERAYIDGNWHWAKRTVILYEALQKIRRRHGINILPEEEHPILLEALNTARNNLTNGEFKSAERSGNNMTYHAIVAFALEERQPIEAYNYAS